MCVCEERGEGWKAGLQPRTFIANRLLIRFILFEWIWLSWEMSQEMVAPRNTIVLYERWFVFWPRKHLLANATTMLNFTDYFQLRPKLIIRKWQCHYWILITNNLVGNNYTILLTLLLTELRLIFYNKTLRNWNQRQNVLPSYNELSISRPGRSTFILQKIH